MRLIMLSTFDDVPQKRTFCSDVNHAVLAVGYGQEHKDKQLKFWDVKNSWGDSWGHKVGFVWFN